MSKTKLQYQLTVMIDLEKPFSKEKAQEAMDRIRRMQGVANTELVVGLALENNRVVRTDTEDEVLVEANKEWRKKEYGDGTA